MLKTLSYLALSQGSNIYIHTGTLTLVGATWASFTGTYKASGASIIEVPAPPSPPLAPPIGAQGDPHLALPHGGKADFRGEDKALYNFLSAPGLSLNVMTELADFELHPANLSEPQGWRHKHVHGSFLTQAHVVARTDKGTAVRVSFYADKIGERNIAWANGTIDSQPAFKLGPKMKKAVDNVTLYTDYSSLHVLNPEYELIITPNLFRLERNVVGLHHRLDIQAKLRVDERDLSVPPHGIIGQAWDGDGLAIDGETDAFPNMGEFTTYAMAKGAIEGAPNDYKVAKPYATDFKFSRFDATSGAPRDVAKLVAAGVLNVPKKVLTGEGFVGATENHVDDHKAPAR